MANNEFDYLDEDSGKGYDGVKTNNPRIKIAHFTTPEVLPGDEQIKGLEAGMFFNTVTKKIYGKTLSFLPVKPVRVWLERTPKEAGSKFRGKHFPYSIPIVGDLFSGARTLEGNVIQEAVEVYGYIEGEMELGMVCLSLTGDSVRHTDAWMTQTKLIKTPSGKIAALYAGFWELTLEINSNDKGKWFTFGKNKVTNAKFKRFATAEEIQMFVRPSVALCENYIRTLMPSAPAASGTSGYLPESTEY